MKYNYDKAAEGFVGQFGWMKPKEFVIGSFDPTIPATGCILNNTI